jgi:hypothetical protein
MLNQIKHVTGSVRRNQGVFQAVQWSWTVSTMYGLGIGASEPNPKGSFISAAQLNENVTPRSDLDMNAQTKSFNTTEHGTH